MAEFTVGEFDYKSSTMDAMTQLHVVRRFSPALGAVSEMLPAMRSAGMDAKVMSAILVANTDDPELKEHQEALGKAVEALGKALGSLSDEATDYVVTACLSLCERRPKGKDGSWSPVWNRAAGKPQHADINMGVMLMVVWKVLSAELSGFFPGNPSPSATG